MSELKKYLDTCCKELGLESISDATLKILDDNEINKTNLSHFDQAEFKEIKIPIGSIKTLMCIINDQKNKAASIVATASNSPTSGNSSSNEKNKNSVSSENNNKLTKSSNSNDDDDAPTNAVSASRTLSAIADDEKFARQLQQQLDDQERQNGLRQAASSSSSRTNDGDALLQQLSQAADASAFKVVANNIHRIARADQSGSATIFDYCRLVEIVTKNVSFLDEDESISALIGSSLVNIRANTPTEKQSFALDEQLLNLAYDRVTNAQRDETKLRWLAVVANAWVSVLKKLGRGSIDEDPFYNKFARKFAPVVLELMKKESFDDSALQELSEDINLQLLIRLWSCIALSDMKECMNTQQEGGVVIPLFDFASLQLLLGNGVVRATSQHTASTQETLALLLGTAHNVADILIPTNTINVRAITNSIHRCLEECASLEAVTSLIRLLYRMYLLPGLRKQMDEHFDCEEIVAKLKKSSNNNAKAKEMVDHFEIINKKKLKESLEQLFGTIGAVASSGLMDVLVKANVDATYLSSLKKAELHRLPIYDHKQQKELEGYVERLAAASLPRNSDPPGIRQRLGHVETSSSTELLNEVKSCISTIVNVGDSSVKSSPSIPVVHPLLEEVKSQLPGVLVLSPVEVGLKKNNNNKLGAGGYGDVYMATIVSQRNRRCAAKIFYDKDIAIQEAKNLFHLDHPNVVRLLGVTVEDTPNPSVVLLFERADCDLKRFIKSKLPLRTVRRFIKQIARGLDYLHQVDPVNDKRCIVHLDIKPENFMMVFGKGNRYYDKSISTSLSFP